MQCNDATSLLCMGKTSGDRTFRVGILTSIKFQLIPFFSSSGFCLKLQQRMFSSPKLISESFVHTLVRHSPGHLADSKITTTTTQTTSKYILIFSFKFFSENRRLFFSLSHKVRIRQSQKRIKEIIFKLS